VLFKTLTKICELIISVAGLSKVLGKIAMAMASLPTSSTTVDPMAAAILHDYVENFREDLPAFMAPSTCPMVYQTYWHCRILVAFLTPSSTPNTLLWPTSELITLLSADPEVKTPLTHHFSNLIILSLSKLVQLDETKESAVQLARDIVDQPGAAWDDMRDKFARLSRPTSSGAEGTASQGLQHLADLATATDANPGSGEDAVGLAQGASLALGYLDLV
jgi:hypothetical protein